MPLGHRFAISSFQTLLQKLLTQTPLCFPVSRASYFKLMPQRDTSLNITNICPLFSFSVYLIYPHFFESDEIVFVRLSLFSFQL